MNRRTWQTSGATRHESNAEPALEEFAINVEGHERAG